MARRVHDSAMAPAIPTHEIPEVAAGPVRFLLASKPPPVWSLSSKATVFEAISVMAEKGVGALLVMDGSALIGIISERDYARKVILRGRSSKDTPIGEIMTSPVITVSPDHSIEQCMRLMTEKRIRHLPVVEDGLVAGIVSIGDIIKVLLSAQAQAIRYLSAYIAGSYPA